jgi:hypothetical protein
LKEHFGNSGNNGNNENNGNNGNLVKIMYRCAQAYIGKGEYEMAKIEVEKMRGLEGGSEEVKRLEKEIENKVK